MAPLSTRAAVKSKLAKSSVQRPKLQNSPNCSIISISHHSDSDDICDGKFTAQDIISDLRNKLSNTQQMVVDLELINNQLKSELKQSINLNNMYTAQLADHTKTIDILTQKIHSRTLVNTSTQTDGKIDALPPSTQKQVQTLLPENPSQMTTTNTEHRARILLLSDSHGRNLSQELEDHLNNKKICEDRPKIESIFKPNATFGQTCNNIKHLIKNFNEQDNVFITAGTNDDNIETFKESVYDLLSSCPSVNLHITTVPYRYDRPGLNSFIFEKNKFLFDLSSNFKFKLIDINLFLDRADYTKHGLHFNRRGKFIIADVISEFLKSNKKFFLNSRN